MRGKVQDEAGDNKEHSGHPVVAQRPFDAVTNEYELHHVAKMSHRHTRCLRDRKVGLTAAKAAVSYRRETPGLVRLGGLVAQSLKGVLRLRRALRRGAVWPCARP
jgi:hypothetical protein